MPDDTRVQIAVHREREGTGNRSCRHHQQICPRPLCPQRIALTNAEPMLLVYDDKAEPFERHVVPEHRMRAE